MTSYDESMTKIELRQRFHADSDTVWQALTDHEGMPRWSPLKSVILKKEGRPERNGKGAVRVMKALGPPLIEEVVAWDPPTRYDYKLKEGAPIRNHLGRVTVHPVGSHTDVTWDIEFDALVPGTGWLFRAVLGKAIGNMLGRLARQLEVR